MTLLPITFTRIDPKSMSKYLMDLNISWFKKKTVIVIMTIIFTRIDPQNMSKCFDRNNKNMTIGMNY